MNEPLAQIFRYNAWANARIIDGCAALTDAQLDARPDGEASRSIRETLLHVVTGQMDFLARLDGRAQSPDKPPEWPGFDALHALSQATSDVLIAAAESMDGDAIVVVPYAGARPAFPRSFFLTHAIAHGVEHRTQIGVMLTRLGAAAPDLDGWPYAAAAGFGAET
jgi:uncharacterized damage-inducible protein DinB